MTKRFSRMHRQKKHPDVWHQLIHLPENCQDGAALPSGHYCFDSLPSVDCKIQEKRSDIHLHIYTLLPGVLRANV